MRTVSYVALLNLECTPYMHLQTISWHEYYSVRIDSVWHICSDHCALVLCNVPTNGNQIEATIA